MSKLLELKLFQPPRLEILRSSGGPWLGGSLKSCSPGHFPDSEVEGARVLVSQAKGRSRVALPYPDLSLHRILCGQ